VLSRCSNMVCFSLWLVVKGGKTSGLGRGRFDSLHGLELLLQLTWNNDIKQWSKTWNVLFLFFLKFERQQTA
jgi:hypothetical protein